MRGNFSENLLSSWVVFIYVELPFIQGFIDEIDIFVLVKFKSR
jgi:hypothetical protein